MNNDQHYFPDILKEYLTITLEPDIRLSDTEQIYLDQCLSHLYDTSHLPLVLHCTLVSVSSVSNPTTITRESTRANHYLRVRQPRKFYWMRNVKEMYLNLRLPTRKTEQITANLIEFHSCKRLPHSARAIIQQIRPIFLVYCADEHLLKLNIRGENCLLQLVFPAVSHPTQELQKGIYYKWSDEGRIRSTTIQFHIDYHNEKHPLPL